MRWLVATLLCGCTAPDTVTHAELDRRLAEQEQRLRAELTAELDRRAPQPVLPIAPIAPDTPPAQAKPAAKRVDVSAALSAVDADMRARGLRWDDAPALVELREMAKRAAAQGDPARAFELVRDVKDGAAALRVDRAFVQAKYKRASDAVKAKKPDGAARAEVDRLFTETTAHVSEGQLELANQKLNRIFVLVGAE